jgi:hypothetical protein
VTTSRLVAVGWATVDLERAAKEWGDDGLEALPNDPQLGARVVRLRDVDVVLLEPATEGRLAASLARFGEGPLAVYLRPPPAREAGPSPALGRVAAGPFGRQALVRGLSRFGPHVVVVLDPPRADTIEP